MSDTPTFSRRTSCAYRARRPSCGSFGERFFRRHCARLSVFWVGLPPCASKRGFIDPDVQPTDLRTICVGGRSVRFSVVIAGGSFRLLGRAPALRFQKRLQILGRVTLGLPTICVGGLRTICVLGGLHRSVRFPVVIGGGSFRLLGRAPALRFQKRLHRPRRPAHGPPHDMCRRPPSFGEVFRRHCARLSVFWVGLPPCASKRGFIDPDVQPTDLRTICVGGLHRSVRFSVVIAQGFPSFGSGSRPALPKEASDTRTCNPRTSARYVQEVLVQAISLRRLRPRGRGPKSSPPS